MSMSEILISGLLIIIGVVLTLVINGINRQIDGLGKRIDDFQNHIGNRFDNLKELFKAELRITISPITKDIASIQQDLTNHVTDTDKKIDDLRNDIKETNEKLDLLLSKIK